MLNLFGYFRGAPQFTSPIIAVALYGTIGVSEHDGVSAEVGPCDIEQQMALREIVIGWAVPVASNAVRRSTRRRVLFIIFII